MLSSVSSQKYPTIVERNENPCQELEKTQVIQYEEIKEEPIVSVFRSKPQIEYSALLQHNFLESSSTCTEKMSEQKNHDPENERPHISTSQVSEIQISALDESMSEDNLQDLRIDADLICLGCLQNFNGVSTMPRRLFCGCSVCETCLSKGFCEGNDGEYGCQACGEVTRVKVLKDGRILVNDKYVRIRDQQGSLLFDETK